MTTTPTESMVTIDSENDATAVGASLYLLDNELRPEAEWDPLPEHLTAEDIIRAKRRLEARRARIRIGAAETEKYPQPHIRQQFICITMGCKAVSDRPGACDKCQRDIAAGMFDGWRGRRMRWFVRILGAIAAGCLVWAAITYPWGQ